MSKVILILANSDIGLYKFRKELIERLLSNGKKVYISVPRGPYVSRLKDLGCGYIKTSFKRRGKNPITDFKLFIKYINIIKKVKPDIVLTYTIKPNVYGGLACRLLGTPYISNITGLGSAVENKGILQNISLFLYRISLKKAPCVFFQNEENKRFLIDKHIAVHNNKLIPGSGVNLNYFELIDYPVNDDEVHFLFIARIMKEKGIDYYLEAAKYIKKKYPFTYFHVLGECDENYIDILDEMHAKGIIIYHGRQDDVRKFHKFSHCTIHPTYYPEGMSNVLLETAASGRPIIATNKAGCREIVDNKVSGFLVQQKNLQDLISKIEDFLKLSYKEKKQMGLKGREKVEKEFNREIVVKAYLREISRCLDDRNFC